MGLTGFNRARRLASGADPEAKPEPTEKDLLVVKAMELGAVDEDGKAITLSSGRRMGIDRLKEAIAKRQEGRGDQEKAAMIDKAVELKVVDTDGNPVTRAILVEWDADRIKAAIAKAESAT